MKTLFNFTYFLVILSLVWGCECEIDSLPPSQEVIMVTLSNSDEYVHDFQVCGDEEGATIKTDPQHAEISEIIRGSDTNWCVSYRYKPAQGFVGKDFVEIETCTGGGANCTKKEVVKIEFTVVEECSEQLNVVELKNTWVLEGFIDKETKQSEALPEGFSAEFTFHGDNCIAVEGPCNTGQGNYTLSGNEIELKPLIVTEIACELDEDKFFRNLNGTYCISGNKLTIISNFEKNLVLKKAEITKKFYHCSDFE